MSKASDLIEEYLSVGGLFNPEIMNQNQHDAVRDTLIIARDEIRGLEDRIKRLEEENDSMRADLLLWGDNLRLQQRINRLEEALDKTSKAACKHIKQLESEVYALRLYGNKDCTAMADQALKEAKP